jgi:hypothetical protein
MSDGIPLGTIAGLPVRANWSVLVLLWLFAWSLATTLPQTVPGYHTRDYWVARSHRCCGAADVAAGT